MIAFFPKAYEDELLYSQISRYHQRSGYARFVFTETDIYKNGITVHPSVEFVNKYTDDAMRWITKDTKWAEVVEKHTMYPAYIRFLPLERRKEALEGVMNCNGNWKKLMCLPVLNEKRFLQYCPKCAKEDREVYGETYWHREHQISRIRVCHKHKCFLENSDIPISSKTSPGLFDAQNNVSHKVAERNCDCEREVEFTKYVADVFRQPIDFATDFSIGAFLHERLGSNYKNKSGISRNMERLYADYTAFYSGFPIMSQTYMQKIFNGYMYDVYFILQLAFFEGISVFDITHLPSNTQHSGMEELYAKLSEKYHIDCSIVSAIGREVLKNKTKNMRMSVSREKVYEELDKKHLSGVKKTVKKILSKDGRPERVSVAKVQRMMGLPQKQLNKLPRCKNYIDKHIETQESFWAREVEWAIGELQREGKSITLSKMMKMTNMRKNDIEGCLRYIQNQETKALLGQITSK